MMLRLSRHYQQETIGSVFKCLKEEVDTYYGEAIGYSVFKIWQIIETK